MNDITLSKEDIGEFNQELSMVERLTIDPNVDTEKLQTIINMQYAEEDRRAKKEFIKAMVRVQTNLRYVSKSSKNPSTNSAFANLESLKKAVVPAYTAEGFMLTYGEGECSMQDYIRVTAKLMHSGGHVEEYFYECPMDDTGIKGTTNKTKTHGKASAVSYSERYIMKLIFNVTIQDEDNDGNTATGNYRYINEFSTEIENATVFINNHTDGFGDLENSISFTKIWELLPVEVTNQHHENLPKGNASAIKKALKEMSYEVRSYARKAADEILPLISANDDSGIREILDELTTKTEKAIVWNSLDHPDQLYIKGLKDNQEGK